MGTAGLTIALADGTDIGQAQGILMERFGIDDDRASQVLKRVSSRTNTRLQRVAADLPETRPLPPA